MSHKLVWTCATTGLSVLKASTRVRCYARYGFKDGQASNLGSR